jgi:hypothetical protein
VAASPLTDSTPHTTRGRAFLMTDLLGEASERA